MKRNISVIWIALFMIGVTLTGCITTKQIIATEGAPKAIGPYSQALVAGGFVYVSGQIPLDPVSGELLGADTASQTERVLDNLEAILEAAGVGLTRVVRTTIYLTDLGDFAAVNEVYARRFGDHRPARATLQVAALPKGSRVEIDAVALAPEAS